MELIQKREAWNKGKQMADASQVTLRIQAARVPLLAGDMRWPRPAACPARCSAISTTWKTKHALHRGSTTVSRCCCSIRRLPAACASASRSNRRKRRWNDCAMRVTRQRPFLAKQPRARIIRSRSFASSRRWSHFPMGRQPVELVLQRNNPFANNCHDQNLHI